jgi:hypothetical protein
MKIIFVVILFFPSLLFSSPLPYNLPVIKAQKILVGRTFETPIWNTGIFNQQLGTFITPGLQWPESSNKFLVLSSGLCIGTFVNGQLRLATASYTGEFAPGYILNANNSPIVKTNEAFKLYRVSRGDNAANNPDYANWGDMVSIGAPYEDVNLNFTYDAGIDIAGVKNSLQTIFVCLTDGFVANHSSMEGFSGGTPPVFAEVKLTVWTYDYPELEDIQFLRYVVKNKNVADFKNTYLSMFFHAQIGDSSDDYIGCDTIRNLGYAYNKDNMDGTGEGNSYGETPPSVGIKQLNKVGNNYGMTSFHYVTGEQFEPKPVYCEMMPRKS